MKVAIRVLAATVGLLCGGAAMAGAEDDQAMQKLAATSGCMTCHAIKSGTPGPKGMDPIGPAWQDVAKQYAGKPGAQDFLTRVVLEGSSPYSSHWKGKVSGLAMPPNSSAIKETDARLLVSWILSLGQ